MNKAVFLAAHGIWNVLIGTFVEGSSVVSRQAGLVFSLVLSVLWSGVCLAQQPPVTDSMIGWSHYEDPALEISDVELVWPREMQLPWLRALQTDEADLRREMADTIVLAVGLGMEPLAEYEQVLREIACDPAELIATRLSATNAIIVCDFRNSADALAGTLDECPLSMRILIEKAFSKWDYAAMRKVWQERLKDNGSHPELYRIATEAFATVGDEVAVPVLKEIVVSKHESVTRRLLAATAWSRICVAADRSDDEQLEMFRALLAGVTSPRSPDKLVAVRCLRGSDSKEATELLITLSDDSWNVVRSESLAQLAEIDPSIVVGLAESRIHDSDANVRRTIIDALATEASEKNSKLLASCLDDVVPKNRRAARDCLIKFAAEDSLKETVIADTGKVLASESWRELEQALLVLTVIGDRGKKSRIFELLEHPRPEVFVTAAWSLKRLAEESWGDEIFAALERQVEKIRDRSMSYQGLFAATHLIESMGILGYKQALPVLETMVPKGAPYSLSMRCAAVWSIGFLVDVEADSNIVSQVEERFMDFSAFPPEEPEVRATAAVALGRMKSLKSLDILRERAEIESARSMVGIRAYWAISQMTDEPMPEVPRIGLGLGGWAISAAADVIN